MKTLQLTVLLEDAGTRADSFLQRRTDLTRSAAERLLEEKQVFKGGVPIRKSYRMAEGDILELVLPDPKESGAAAQDIALDVVYEDRDLIVVNKPVGMVVHPSAGHEEDTLVNALLFHCRDSLSGIGGELRPGIVHRIDKDTSGLLVCAKNDAAHLFLSEHLKDHSIRRTYYALVQGGFRDEEGTVNAPIGRSPRDRKKMAVVPDGKPAVTHYRVLERFSGFTLLECNLETGRTHQIRVHMAHIGHPLMGDTLYGGGHTAFEKQNHDLLCGQCLHAGALELVHPRTGETMRFTCPLPPYFEELLLRLRRLSSN